MVDVADLVHHRLAAAPPRRPGRSGLGHVDARACPRRRGSARSPGSHSRVSSHSRYACAVAAVSQPQCRPMTSCTISIREFGVVLGDDVRGEPRALLGRGPGAERLPDRDDVVVDGLGQPDHGQVVVVVAPGSAARSAAVVLVSSPPMVCSTSTPSAVSRSAATSSGSSPSAIRPRLTRSLVLVSLTRRVADRGAAELVQQRGALARTSGVTARSRPVSRPW